MLINKLLERDEIEGFIAVAAVAPPQVGQPAGVAAGAAAVDNAPAEAPKPPPPPPPGKRTPRRHRRGL
jgi:hypothetical protein